MMGAAILILQLSPVTQVPVLGFSDTLNHIMHITLIGWSNRQGDIGCPLMY